MHRWLFIAGCLSAVLLFGFLAFRTVQCGCWRTRSEPPRRSGPLIPVGANRIEVGPLQNGVVRTIQDPAEVDAFATFVNDRWSEWPDLGSAHILGGIVEVKAYAGKAMVCDLQIGPGFVTGPSSGDNDGSKSVPPADIDECCHLLKVDRRKQIGPLMNEM